MPKQHFRPEWVASDNEAYTIDFIVQGTRYRYWFSKNGPPVQEILEEFRSSKTPGRAFAHVKRISLRYEKV